MTIRLIVEATLYALLEQRIGRDAARFKIEFHGRHGLIFREVRHAR